MLPLPRGSAWPTHPWACLLIQREGWTELCGGKTRDAGFTALSSGAGSPPQDCPNFKQLQGSPSAFMKSCLNLIYTPPPRLSQTPPLSPFTPAKCTRISGEKTRPSGSLHTSTAAGTAVSGHVANRHEAKLSHGRWFPPTRGGCGLTRQEGKAALPQGGQPGTLPSAARERLGLQPSPQALPLLTRRASGGLKPEEGRTQTPTRQIRELAFAVNYISSAGSWQFFKEEP